MNWLTLFFVIFFIGICVGVTCFGIYNARKAVKKDIRRYKYIFRHPDGEIDPYSVFIGESEEDIFESHAKAKTFISEHPSFRIALVRMELQDYSNVIWRNGLDYFDAESF